MVLILLFLNIAYFILALGISVPSYQSVLILALMFAGYILLFTFIWPKPEHAVYAFLLVILFVPQGGEKFYIFTIKEFPTVTLNFLVQSMAATTLCLKIIQSRQRSKLANLAKTNVFFYLIIVSLIILIIQNAIYFSQDNPYGVIFAPQDYVNFGPLLFSTIFLLGCLSFIDDLKKLEIMYGIFLFFGIIIALEAVAYMVLQLPLPFVDRVIHRSGRLMEFFLADFVKVGVLAGVAIGSTLYFAAARRTYLLLALIPVFFIPIIFTYQRTPMAAGVIVIGIFLVLNLLRKFSQTLTPLVVVLVAVAGLFLWQGFGMVDRVTNLLESGRSDYFESYIDSWESRLGAHLRAVDILLYEPFGVGYIKAQDFMGSPAIPSNFQISKEWAAADQFYVQISTGKHGTSSHNFLLDFAVEYGLFGLAALLWLYYLCIANFRSFYLAVKRGHIKNNNLIMLHFANFSILAGLIFFGFYQNFLLYSVLFFFAAVTFIAGKSQPN